MAVSVKNRSKRENFVSSVNEGLDRVEIEREEQTTKKKNRNQKTKGAGTSAKKNLAKQQQTEPEENKEVQTPEPNPAVTKLLNMNEDHTEPQAEPNNQDESGEEKSADSPQAEPETEPNIQENSGEGQSTGSTQTEPEPAKQDPKKTKNPPKKKQDPEPFPMLMKKKKPRGKSLSIYFSKEAADYLEQIAKQDYSISNIVNYIVLKHIHEEEEKKKQK